MREIDQRKKYGKCLNIYRESKDTVANVHKQQKKREQRKLEIALHSIEQKIDLLIELPVSNIYT